VFDSTKQRIQGTEAAAFYRKGKVGGGKGRNEPSKPQVNIIRFSISILNLLLDAKVKLETKT
jgi:hypothetical protein